MAAAADPLLRLLASLLFLWQPSHSGIVGVGGGVRQHPTKGGVGQREASSLHAPPPLFDSLNIR